jgi:hypothetical protein
MKNLILLYGLMLFSFSAVASSQSFICSLNNAKRVISIAEKHSQNDKNRHCSVSCMLALKCNDAEVMMVGILKEFKDVFGPGDADAADIEADLTGVALASKRAARTDGQCLSQCDLYYRP